jgi:hypothetical protein
VAALRPHPRRPGRQPDAFWLQRGIERLTRWVAAAADPQQRRERAEYANAVLEDITAIAPALHTIDNGGIPQAITRAGADNRWQATDQWPQPQTVSHSLMTTTVVPHRTTAEDVQRRQDNAPRTTQQSKVSRSAPRTAAGGPHATSRGGGWLVRHFHGGSRCRAGGAEDITSSCDPCKDTERGRALASGGWQRRAAGQSHPAPMPAWWGGGVMTGSTSMPVTLNASISI